MKRILRFDEFGKLQQDFFLGHLFIEFYYGDEKRNFLYAGETTSSETILFEKYGVFDKCREMSELVINSPKVKLLKNGEHTIVTMPENFVSKSILVELDRDLLSTAAYVYNESKFNQKECVFDEITIVIQDSEKVKLSVLMHELQHAKEDCELRKKGTSTDEKLENIGYKKLMVNLPKPKNVTEEKVYRLVYLFTSFERNAYINSIYGELLDSPKKFTTINAVCSFIKNTGFYRQYDDAFVWTNEFLKLDNNKDEKKVLEYINTITNFHFVKYKDIKKWLKAMLYSYKRKFNTIIPKMAYEVFSEKMSKTFPDSEIMTNYMMHKL